MNFDVPDLAKKAVDKELLDIAMSVLNEVKAGNVTALASIMICRNGQVMTGCRFISGGLDILGGMEMLKSDLVASLRSAAQGTKAGSNAQN